ncbi:integral membrane protein, putative [Babesia ovata]|uniref:Integral membrane protein, putative n=1 Tax=Babesia ovata TaxID=189622 RepID=A0A2H6KJN0_9APIC|nr:integral membrane protein, putative [Babesia ovata]GBE63196.1 integral membrane protein, putative [Babesia ovata]
MFFRSICKLVPVRWSILWRQVVIELRVAYRVIRRLALKHIAKLAFNLTVHVVVLKAGGPLEHEIDVGRGSGLWWDVVVADAAVPFEHRVKQIKNVEDINLVAFNILNFNMSSFGKWLVEKITINFPTRHVPPQVTILNFVTIGDIVAAGFKPEGHLIAVIRSINLFLTPITAAVPLQIVQMCYPTRQTGHENLRQLLAVLSQFAFIVSYSGSVRLKQCTVKLSTAVRANICVAELLGQGADSVLERLQDGTGGVSEFGGGECR